MDKFDPGYENPVARSKTKKDNFSLHTAVSPLRA
jgi:hypothetical protein